MAGFKYKVRDPGAWEKRANQQGGDFIGIIKDEFKTFTPKKGNSFIRILPPTFDDAEHYGLDVHVHYSVGPDKATVLCINKMKGERCPICEARTKAERAGDDELAGELKPSKRVLVWMLDRDDESQGPMIWSMPWTLDRDFTKLARDPRSGEVYLLDHPEEGYDISFEKTGEGIATKYVGTQIARRPSSVDQEFIDYIVEVPLTDTLVFRDYDELKRLFEGGDISPSSQAEAQPEARRAERDPPPAEERTTSQADGKARWRPRGAAPDEKEPPPNEDVRTEEPAREAPRDPPPRASAEPAGGSSKAAELRARFGRK